MLRSVCLRCGVESALPCTDRGSVVEGRRQASFWSVVRVAPRVFAGKRSFRVHASSSFGVGRQNGTALSKPDSYQDQPARVVFPLLARALVNGDFKRPVDLFRAMDEMKMISTVEHCNELLFQLRRVKAAKAMIDFMGYMEQRKMERNGRTYSMVISACSIQSDLERACLYFDQLRDSSNIPVTVYTYQSIIGACVDCNDLERAREYVDEMVDAGVELDAAVIAPVFERLGYRKQHSSKAADMCSALIKELEAQGLRLTPELCTSALWAYSNAGYVESASALYETAKGLGVKFDFDLYNLVLLSLGKNPKHLEMAVGVLEDMKKDGIQPAIYTYHLLLRMFAAARDEVGALALFKELEEAGLKPTLRTYISIFPAFRKTVSEDERVQLWQRIDGLVAKMKNQGFALETVAYWNLVNICDFNCNRDRAERYLQEMKKNGIPLDNKIFVKLIKLEARSNSKEDEKASADRISALLERMDKEGLELDRPCCVDVMYGFLSSKSTEKMEPFMKKMREVGIVYDSLLLKLLFEFWLSTGNEETASRIFEEALQQGLSMHNVNASLLQVLVNMREVLDKLKQADLSEESLVEIDAIVGIFLSP